MKIIEADLSRPGDAEAFLNLTGGYMADKMGDGTPWTNSQKQRVLRDLRQHPSCLILLAQVEADMVAICTCFYGYSTFLAAGLINIHDIYVQPRYRGMGIGRKLLRRVESIARRNGVEKITLEVRDDNQAAQLLYSTEGYSASDPVMLFWSKYIEQADF
jgi:GNAT superfamily N-acetyltransferase